MTFVEPVSLSSASPRRLSVGSSWGLRGGASFYLRPVLSALQGSHAAFESASGDSLIFGCRALRDAGSKTGARSRADAVPGFHGFGLGSARLRLRRRYGVHGCRMRMPQAPIVRLEICLVPWAGGISCVRTAVTESSSPAVQTAAQCAAGRRGNSPAGSHSATATRTGSARRIPDDDDQSSQMSASSASLSTTRSAVFRRSDCSCVPASSRTDSLSQILRSMSTLLPNAPANGGTAPSSNCG